MPSIKFIVILLSTLIIIFLGYLYVTKKSIFDNSIKLYAFAEDPTDISTESLVLINGLKIGKVNRLEILDEKILLELSIKNEIRIKRNSKIFSVTGGLISNRNIDIHLSKEKSDYYKNGDTIQSAILRQNLKETLDPNDEFEPHLKEISRTIGAALLEYGNSSSRSQKIDLDFICKNTKTTIRSSRLKNKITKLSKLESNYQQTKNGKIEIDQSNLIKRFVKFINHLDTTTNNINFTENFKKSIVEINYSHIKGTNEISSNLYPRAKLEEYIFTSEECAENFINNLNKILKNDTDWYNVEKSPSSIYQEENRVYFIISGGWFMKSIYKEIVNEIVKPDDNK